MYASSTTKDGVTTTIVGSGQCEISRAHALKTVFRHGNETSLVAFL